jgi:peptidoglycan/LPS O-acetylase OafA/YrhL
MGKQFQLLRGFAILFVLVNHSIAMSYWMADKFGYALPNRIENILLVIFKQTGMITVPIFLFLSGAFFAFAIQNRPIQGAFRAVWKNVITVLWPYLIWSILFYLLVGVLLGESYTFTGYIKNLIVGYPFNFVPLLIFFYITAPFMVWIARRWPAPVLAFTLVYQLFLANVNVPGTLGFAFPDWARYLTPPVVRESLSLWAFFFPFGVVYYQHQQKLSAVMQKLAPLFLVGGLAFYAMNVLHELKAINFPIALILAPLFAIMLTPVIRRDIVPFYRWVEDVGKKSYGLYLSHLIIITLLLFVLHTFFPWLLEQYLLLVPLLSFSALFIPLGIMRLLEIPADRTIYHYVFG